MSPLDDVTVIDFTKFIAGPLCTQYLGDMGASVIKIEDCGRGDDLRGMPPFIGDDGAMFYGMNRNKRSLALNLKSSQGLDVARQLICKADVLIESFGTGVASRLGIGPEEMRKLNPRLVYCSVSGFGRTGPKGERPGYELMMQAHSGLMLTTGEPGSGPLRIGFSPLDQTTGIHAVSAILGGLRLRDRTGDGTFVEVSLLETAMGLMAWHAQTYWMTGERPAPPGSGHESLCPYQAFKAKDGFLLLAIGSDGLWRKFCEAVGIPHLGDSSTFHTNAARVENRCQTLNVVQDIISEKTIEEWTCIFVMAGIPSSPINNIDTALKDPQLTARQVVMTYEHPVGGRMKSMAHPVLFEGTPRVVRLPPPMHGEHSREILKEKLDITDGAIDELIRTGSLKADSMRSE